MASHLSWLDHDASQRDRMTRILALFREKDTRDELGLGAIRDAIADQLFPGTSTIQTRLRYMLFVPWIYRALEDERVPSSEIAQRARRREVALVQPLLSDSTEQGVLGRLAKGELKRLPSSVYWAGLGSWGIRRFDGFIDQYHRQFDLLHRRRTAARKRDDGDQDVSPPGTWDPALPPPPSDFPEGISFTLTKDEAAYLQDRIVCAHRDSFLAWLAQRHRHEPLASPWDWLGMRAGLEPDHRALLWHGRLLSEVGYEAALVYNLALAEHGARHERAKELRDKLETWVKSPERAPVVEWNLNELWPVVVGHGHTIPERARAFVASWVELSRSQSMDVIASTAAKALVQDREHRLKGPRSRFTNKLAYDQWSGAAGLVRADYRWRTASNFLRDLFAGLGA